jgi:hypothetical protein
MHECRRVTWPNQNPPYGTIPCSADHVLFPGDARRAGVMDGAPKLCRRSAAPVAYGAGARSRETVEAHARPKEVHRRGLRPAGFGICAVLCGASVGHAKLLSMICLGLYCTKWTGNLSRGHVGIGNEFLS